MHLGSKKSLSRSYQKSPENYNGKAFLQLFWTFHITGFLGFMIMLEIHYPSSIWYLPGQLAFPFPFIFSHIIISFCERFDFLGPDSCVLTRASRMLSILHQGS